MHITFAALPTSMVEVRVGRDNPGPLAVPGKINYVGFLNRLCARDVVNSTAARFACPPGLTGRYLTMHLR